MKENNGWSNKQTAKAAEYYMIHREPNKRLNEVLSKIKHGEFSKEEASGIIRQWLFTTDGDALRHFGLLKESDVLAVDVLEIIQEL